MHDLLGPSSVSSLLEVFRVSRGRGLTETFPQQQRPVPYSRRWSSALARLTVFETAMLQDFRWWGPQMEDQLKRLMTEQADLRSGS